MNGSNIVSTNKPHNILGDRISRNHIALLLYSLVFGGLTFAVGLLYMDWGTYHSFLYFFCFEFLLVGIAYELTISVMALVSKPLVLPRLSPLADYPRVALLITVCNDALTEILDHLQNQDYPAYDVFILDDSTNVQQLALIDQYSGLYTILRRGTRRAFKAGNLNNWLDTYGIAYPYFVILDSDSMIPPDFIRSMVEYAEHPANLNIAIFQSKILTWNTEHRLPRLLGVLAPLRMYIIERTWNRMGNLLSYGHNVLCRTENVLQVGGFHENLTPEDTILSLMLDARGYSTKMVDVVSYDAEPETIFRYTRRTVRWAKQTVELFRLPWGNSSFFLKLTICYNLYTYLRPFLYFGLLCFMAWTSITTDVPISPNHTVWIVWQKKLYFDPWFITLCVVMGVWILPIVLHFFIAKKTGIRVWDVVFVGLLSVALIHFTVVPMGFGMLQTVAGKQVSFVPTNKQDAHHPTFISIVRYMLIPLLIGMFILFSIILQNQIELFGINCLWIILLICSPLLIWLVHERTNDGKTNPTI